MKNKSFSEKVIQEVRRIPKGKVASYGQIARICGLHRGGLLVGRILHNTIKIGDKITPWWRVVNRQGIISTTCLEHPAPLQASLLQKEGIEVINEEGLLRVDLKINLWKIPKSKYQIPNNS